MEGQSEPGHCGTLFRFASCSCHNRMMVMGWIKVFIGWWFVIDFHSQTYFYHQSCSIWLWKWQFGQLRFEDLTFFQITMGDPGFSVQNVHRGHMKTVAILKLIIMFVTYASNWILFTFFSLVIQFHFPSDLWVAEWNICHCFKFHNTS